MKSHIFESLLILAMFTDVLCRYVQVLYRKCPQYDYDTAIFILVGTFSLHEHDK